MRIVLDLADDVLIDVMTLARRQGRSGGSVLSELARTALGAEASVSGPSASPSFFGFEPIPSRGNTITNELVNRLRDEADC